MKDRYIITIIIIMILILIFLGYKFLFLNENSPIVVSENFVYVENIDATNTHNANNIQYQSSIWMGAYNEQLFIYMHCDKRSKMTNCDGWLCRLKSNGLEKIYRLGNGNIIHFVGSSNQFIYYWVFHDAPLNDLLYCFDLGKNQESPIFSGRASESKTAYFSDDNTVYVPFVDEKDNQYQKYMHISGSEIVNITLQPEYYLFANKKYSLTAGDPPYQEKVVCTEIDGSSYTIELGNATNRSLISTPHGLVVHNEGYSDLLYLICDDGELKTLFHIPCLASRSAITVCESGIILSFKRYEKYGELGMKRYENDTEEGVYKIDLKDLSVTKLSDDIFNGLYIINNKCIFGCDEYCNIYLFTMDGKILPLVINPKSE